MSKVIIVLLVATVAVAIQRAASIPIGIHIIGESGFSGDKAHSRLITRNADYNSPLLLSQDVKTLRGGPGAQVHGHSVTTFTSSSDINGRRSKFSIGHEITNNNGDVVERYFKP